MFKRYWTITCREFIYMWRDRGLRHILLLGPLLGVLLFYGIYQVGVLKAIPTAIVDLDRSRTSQELVNNLIQTENLEIQSYLENFDTLEASIRQGEVVVGVVIPENYSQQVALNRTAHILLVIDGSNMIYATNATSAVLSVSRNLGAQIGIKTLLARGVQLNQAREAYQAIVFREEPWFNPTLNYAYFLVLALALNFWQQCCTLAASMTIIGETGWRSWLQWKAIGISQITLFSCKTIAHLITFMGLVLPIYVFIFLVLKFPLSSSWWTLLSFTFLFVIAMHAVSTMMSSFASNGVDATRFGMLIALPAFILSGYTWPLEVMPDFLQKAVWILPHTWFFQGLNYLLFKDPGWAFLSFYFLALAIIALVAYSVTAIVCYWRNN